MGATVILALDTSGRFAAVASVDDTGAVVFARSGVRPRAHGEELAPLVTQALAGATPDHVVAGRGPGSFTGLRVGLGFAQIFAWARGLPVSGLCSLDVVAHQEGLTDGWVVTDARRGELYVARYEAGRRVGEPEVLSRAAALTRTSDGVVAGDGALLHATERRAAGTTTLDPAGLGRCAFRAVTVGTAEPPTPLYLRRPDVTMSVRNLPGRT